MARDVNVLPYELGLQLGLTWENETLSVLWAGNLARFEARAVVVDARVSSFNVRRQNGEILTDIPNLTRVETLGPAFIEPGWTEVRLPEGTQGYIYSALLRRPSCF